MKHKLLCLLLVLTLCAALCLPAAAASPAIRAANALYTLGLFEGVGQHADGSPIYALDRPLTRQEAVVLLIRLLGLEQAALSEARTQPFADTADWAKPYVALAFERGYVRGVSETRLDANTPVNERGWLTFLLRALGYTEVSYDDPWTLASGLGLVAGAGAGFTRAGAVTLSMTALGLPCAGGADTLLRTLLDADAVTEAEIRDAGLTDALNRRSLSAKEVSALHADAVFYLTVFDSRHRLEADQPYATASGFFVTSDGVALTNYHAVKDTKYAFIQTNDGNRYQVRSILFTDVDRDLAVIRIDPAVLREDRSPNGKVTAVFPCLTMRSAGDVVNGDVVYAIGSPLGLMNSISSGIVANHSRIVPNASPEPYIQVTAAISNGSSGGVLLNEYGDAIGITTATFIYGQNLNLAAPLDPLLKLDLTAAGEPYEGYFDVEPSPYDDMVLYERYPEVPDFGAVCDTPLLEEGALDDGWYYLYDNAAADADALADFYMAMSEWGFGYSYNAENFEMIFTGRGLTVRCGEYTRDDETFYRVSITDGAADTSALPHDLFPWAV